MKRINERYSNWAFLQTYEEVYEDGNINGPILDNDKNNQYNVPFYSANQLKPWSGRYSDALLDNIPAVGSLLIYTSLCEDNLNRQPTDASKWNYKMLCNVKWGFNKSKLKPICINLVELQNSIMRQKLKPVYVTFPGISIS
ncbi:MAG: hypothetical protein AMDU4_FER2C00039G0041 [Ferroplasma sp. Type II]|uniref:hypothetical protein n=1 Tax=Ferroplasma sp. Type II TaxID=261388 RepID=UPI0003896AE9|nr:hypothetical protein [Ferroplasma sp. Type II]EQB73830.1 MAG: hypothetical protein AMDU4_FER2C00039G0041 [Ferroplasma sp. Type II]